MTQFQHSIKHGFERASTAYDAHATLQREVCRDVFSAIEPHLTPSAMLLDAGCGTGYFQELLRSKGHKNTLIQLDLAYAMCTTAHSYASLPEYGHTYTVNADMTALPLAPSTLDIAASSLTMQWLDDIPDALTEILSTLKTNGHFALSIMADGSLDELKQCYEKLGAKAPIHHFHSKQDLETLLAPLCPNLTITQKRYEYSYQDATALLKSLKGIGATYRGARSKNALTRSVLEKLNTEYAAHFSHAEGIKASWHVLFIEGVKA